MKYPFTRISQTFDGIYTAVTKATTTLRDGDQDGDATNQVAEAQGLCIQAHDKLVAAVAENMEATAADFETMTVGSGDFLRCSDLKTLKRLYRAGKALEEACEKVVTISGSEAESRGGYQDDLDY